MERVYLITYDLKEGTRLEYEEIYEEIYEEVERRGGKVCHAMESLWLVIGDIEIDELFGNMQEKLDNDDKLIVVEIPKDKRGCYKIKYSMPSRSLQKCINRYSLAMNLCNDNF